MKREQEQLITDKKIGWVRAHEAHIQYRLKSNWHLLLIGYLVKILPHNFLIAPIYVHIFVALQLCLAQSVPIIPSEAKMEKIRRSGRVAWTYIFVFISMQSSALTGRPYPFPTSGSCQNAASQNSPIRCERLIAKVAVCQWDSNGDFGWNYAKLWHKNGIKQKEFQYPCKCKMGSYVSSITANPNLESRLLPSIYRSHKAWSNPSYPLQNFMWGQPLSITIIEWNGIKSNVNRGEGAKLCMLSNWLA